MIPSITSRSYQNSLFHSRFSINQVKSDLVCEFCRARKIRTNLTVKKITESWNVLDWIYDVIVAAAAVKNVKFLFYMEPIIFIFDGKSPSRKPLFMSWQRFAFNEINYWALNVFIMTSSQQLDEPVFFKDFFFRKKNISPFLYNNDNEENYTSIFWKIM